MRKIIRGKLVFKWRVIGGEEFFFRILEYVFDFFFLFGFMFFKNVIFIVNIRECVIFLVILGVSLYFGRC